MKPILFGLLSLVLMGFAQAGEPVADYAVVLRDVPAASRVSARAELRGEAAQAYVRQIRGAQSAVEAELRHRNIAVAGSDQVLANVIFVTTTPDAAKELLSLPGVVHVVHLPRFKRALNTAADLVNAQAGWNASGGANAGAGVRIGIIDSGIDNTHAAFQDSSLTPPPGFPVGDTSYTSGKIIAARSYIKIVAVGYNADPTSPAATSLPDDYSPRDRSGHGTAIAMIAAGARNTGPLGSIQGIAPKAFLGNYKIFGSPGINDYTSYAALHQALLDAHADNMDVVTLALGEGDTASWGPLDVDPSCQNTDTGDSSCDVRAQAVENVVKMGMVVVAAAGNGGNSGVRYPTLGTINSPGTAPSAITVGATTNSHMVYRSVKVNGSSVPSALQRINATAGDGPQLANPLTAPVRDVAYLGNDGQACAALSAGSLSGAIALIQQGSCNFNDKINNAQAAGAVGAIIYQTSGSTTIGGTANTGIPAMMIANSDGVALKNYLAPRSDSPTVTFDPTLAAAGATANQVAPFSSRGPSIGTFASSQYATTVIKPEVVAPGVGIYTATQKLDSNGDAYHPSGYSVVSGTSYSVGFVAGTVALVKQRNPTLKAAQLKSAVVNTATQDVTDGSETARVNAVGAGKLNVGEAVNAPATMDPVTISFGPIGAASLPIRRNLSITNIGGTAATFTLTVKQRDSDSNAGVQLSMSSMTLAAGQANSVVVTLSGSRPNPGSYEGTIEISGSGHTMRVPYQYLVGSGTPYNAFPVWGGFFTMAPQDITTVLLRVEDQYGVPVVGTSVAFAVTKGGGSIVQGDSQTYAYGIAGAQVRFGNSTGDQIYTGTASGLTVEFDGYAHSTPTLRAQSPILDAATFRSDIGFAPGSYLAIFGSGLSDATQVEPTASLPVSLSATSVSFDSLDGSLSLPGHIHFVTPGQVNVQVPWEFQGKGNALIKVTNSYFQSSVKTISIANYSPGVFEYSDNGTRIAAAIDVDPANGNWFIVSGANKAKRGHTLELFLNGLGPVTNQPASGEPALSSPLSWSKATPAVSIGGVSITPGFYGLTPGAVGLYQVNVTLPAGLSTGNLPIVVNAGGVAASTSTIPVE